MWRSEVNGRRLNFHLVGVNNQNFIMEDEQTGTWWQQITGEAIQGPLKGEFLEPMPYDTVSFEIWRSENPKGRVLAVEEGRLNNYASADWAERMQNTRVPRQLIPDGDLGPRDLVVGIDINGRAKAYPLKSLQEQTPISDRIGDARILLAVAADGKSVRAYSRVVDGTELELYAVAGADPPAFFDAGSGSQFDFRGVAVSGPLEGHHLERIDSITEFWFDWHEYHKDTAVYRAGTIPGR